MNKALRGELFIAVPVGYVILPDGKVDMDPDEQVRAVVHLVFEKFDELGSGHAVFVYLRQHNIRLPIRPHTGPHRGRLEWREATFCTVSSMLRHPIYGGAYVYGRRRQVRRADGTLARQWLPQEEWKVLLPDNLPGYISWEQYLNNRRRLHDNRSTPDTPGTPRGGSALLAGLAVCRCGRQLRVQYEGRGEQDARYVCDRASKLGRTDACGGIQARVLDELVTQQLLLALEPASLELSLCAAEDVQRERQRLDQHWRGRLERARYEAFAPSGSTIRWNPRTAWSPARWRALGKRNCVSSNKGKKNMLASKANRPWCPVSRSARRLPAWPRTFRPCGRPRKSPTPNERRLFVACWNAWKFASNSGASTWT